MKYQPMRTRAASFDEVGSLHTISEAAESLILMIAMVDIQRWFEAARSQYVEANSNKKGWSKIIQQLKVTTVIYATLVFHKIYP